MGGARIYRGGNVLLWLCGGVFLMGFGGWHGGGVMTTIMIVVANVGYCGYCVFFFLVLLVCGRCSGRWCGCFWISMVFFFGWCPELEGEREEKEERERERERERVREIVKKIFK